MLLTAKIFFFTISQKLFAQYICIIYVCAMIFDRNSEDVRTQVYEYIRDKGISQSRIAALLNLERSTLHNILKCRSPLSEKRLKEINEFLGTNFKHENNS